MSRAFRQAFKMAHTIPATDIPSLSLLYKLHKLKAAPSNTKLPATPVGPAQIPAPSKALNDRIGLVRGDITTLGVDAIVNAANSSLLGGGGVDGAIHRAAGRGLLEECYGLNGCKTGSAKITGAYNLPSKKVIHAVGPIYDPMRPDISETYLTGCYATSLDLAARNDCKTIAFSAISTGVYGYPSREAAAVAISTVRDFLEKNSMIEKAVFVTFTEKDVKAYNEFLPLYFPPIEGGATESREEDEKEAKIEAEAKAVADELPSAPTTNPVDPIHPEKKQKTDDA
ncbi:A1pp-domain-containing protein [Thozetella sp. PMI_491]|nr:A1pp-domain-containing protein [Thozetella sp. PMI_491]